jgi:hypothetical protein
MEPEYIFVQQMKACAEEMENNLRYINNYSMSWTNRYQVLKYAYHQGGMMKDLLDSYFSQLHSIERGMTSSGVE